MTYTFEKSAVFSASMTGTFSPSTLNSGLVKTVSTINPMWARNVALDSPVLRNSPSVRESPMNTASSK